MTSHPAFTERNIQRANAYLLYSRQEQKSLVTYHTLQSLYVCVWLVNTLTSTAPIGSPIICMWSPADICEQWERNLSQFNRRSWGRNAWRTPKNVCGGGYFFLYFSVSSGYKSRRLTRILWCERWHNYRYVTRKSGDWGYQSPNVKLVKQAICHSQSAN